MALLEIACFTPESAILAFNAGADRIELCDNREAGGTTPSLASLLLVKGYVTIPVFVMIRPRGRNFNYSDEEFEQMLDDIDRFKKTANGFVFGILSECNDVDTARTTVLAEKASPLPCTFHRAFDETRDKLKALEDVVACGCQAVLTSGGALAAAAGASLLRELVGQAGDRIQVIVGGGVRTKNVVRLAELTNAHAYHSSAILGDTAEAGINVEEVRQLKTFLRALSG